MSLDRLPADDGIRGLEVVRDGLAEAMAGHVDPAAALMKALSHPGRLLILCHLAGGAKAVHELEALTGHRQAAVSQQLARLRMEGLVTTRRAGKAIIYALSDQRVVPLLSCLPGLFDKSA